MPIIDFKAAMCKHCYKCVRGCEVKSIMIRDGHAYIMPNRCILCGQCLQICPQSAKNLSSELLKVKGYIDAGLPVVLSLSSSYIGLFHYKKRGQVKAALKKLGFADVRDSAEGAAFLTAEYVKLLGQGDMKNIITTACPSIVELMEIHYPELLDYLTPTLTPSGVHARMLRREYGPEARIVFAGPCIAEKKEARHVREEQCLDAVLTFEEIHDWLKTEGFSFDDCEEEEFEELHLGANLRYPVSGGLLTAVSVTKEKKDHYRKFYVSGVKDCLDVCEALKTGEVKNCFIEMNACHGGCINGPATGGTVSSFKVKLDLEELLPKEKAELDKICPEPEIISVERHFSDHSQKEKMPTEEEISAILAKTGITRPEHELNCGACGYPTCREKAVAVHQGKAEVNMCIPYLHEQAKSMSHLVMETSPNIIMVLDEDMKILECSAAVEKYFDKKRREMRGCYLNEFLDTEDVKSVFETHKSIHSKKVVYEKQGFVMLQNLAYIARSNMVIATFIDVTKDEELAQREQEKREETMDLAQKVIYKQMMVAQEIAGLLGETTAETKTTLTKLCTLLNDGNDRGVR